MKSVRVALALLVITLCAVIANSIVLRHTFDAITDKVEKTDDSDISAAHEQYTKIFDEFKEKEWFISFTVNHEDLTNVEDALSEIIGATKAGDIDAVITIKSRLTNSLEHLSRLSGINIESIF